MFLQKPDAAVAVTFCGDSAGDSRELARGGR